MNLTVSVPWNTSAMLEIPSSTHITVNGKPTDTVDIGACDFLEERMDGWPGRAGSRSGGGLGLHGRGRGAYPAARGAPC